MNGDNRNIITLEELKEKESGEFLSEEQINEYLYKYKGRIPSVLLSDIQKHLKGKKVTKEQLESIMEKVEKSLTTKGGEDSKIDNVLKKLEELERVLKLAVESPEYVPEHVTGDGHVQVNPEPVHRNELRNEPRDELRDKVDKEIGTVKYTVEYSILGKPRLERIKDDLKSVVILLKWIEFLLEKVGYDGFENVLNYYVDINWISDDVMLTMLRYVKGLKVNQNTDYQMSNLSVQDHMISLFFIEMLRNGKFDRNAVLEIEKEIYKMRREVIELHGL